MKALGSNVGTCTTELLLQLFFLSVWQRCYIFKLHAQNSAFQYCLHNSFVTGEVIIWKSYGHSKLICTTSHLTVPATPSHGPFLRMLYKITFSSDNKILLMETMTDEVLFLYWAADPSQKQQIWFGLILYFLMRERIRNYCIGCVAQNVCMLEINHKRVKMWLEHYSCEITELHHAQ
jgi:hypothetical protein